MLVLTQFVTRIGGVQGMGAKLCHRVLASFRKRIQVYVLPYLCSRSNLSPGPPLWTLMLNRAEANKQRMKLGFCEDAPQWSDLRRPKVRSETSGGKMRVALRTLRSFHRMMMLKPHPQDHSGWEHLQEGPNQG